MTNQLRVTNEKKKQPFDKRLLSGEFFSGSVLSGSVDRQYLELLGLFDDVLEQLLTDAGDIYCVVDFLVRTPFYPVSYTHLTLPTKA